MVGVGGLRQRQRLSDNVKTILPKGDRRRRPDKSATDDPPSSPQATTTRSRCRGSMKQLIVGQVFTCAGFPWYYVM